MAPTLNMLWLIFTTNFHFLLQKPDFLSSKFLLEYYLKKQMCGKIPIVHRHTSMRLFEGISSGEKMLHIVVLLFRNHGSINPFQFKAALKELTIKI